MSRKIRVEESSGNVFADIGTRNPEEKLLRSQLLLAAQKVIKRRRLSQARIAALAGIKQPEVPNLVNGKFTAFSAPLRRRAPVVAGARRGLRKAASSKRRPLEKRQRPAFDALAPGRARHGRRVVEGGVRGEAGAAVLRRIVALDQQRLVRPQRGEIEPAMRRVVGDAVDLAGAVGIDKIGGDEIRWLCAARIGEGERRVGHGAGDRAPDIDDGEAPAERVRRIRRRQQVADALRAGFLGVVVVGDIDRRARLGAAVVVADAADRVVEDQHLARAGGRRDQRRHLAVIEGLARSRVVEIAHPRRRRDQREALLVEGQVAGEGPSVGDGHVVRVAQRVDRLGLAGLGIDEDRRLRGGRLQVVDAGDDRRGLDRAPGADLVHAAIHLRASTNLGAIPRGPCALRLYFGSWDAADKRRFLAPLVRFAHPELPICGEKPRLTASRAMRRLGGRA
ncbi:MAG: XRE family transcriptional regulator [Rhodospirillaceae bacterium]|nr:XRE family transcriptional regulator [Rhodospirillaceae bacterium]